MTRIHRSQQNIAQQAKSGSRSFFILALALAFAALTTSGCAIFESVDSFSESSGSVSDSLGSFSDSSESSSGSSGDETAYRNDLRDFTVAHVQASLSPEALRLGISEVALARGISDWGALPGTFHAVGAGLAEAGLSVAQSAPYRAALAQPGSDRAKALIAGFERHADHHTSDDSRAHSRDLSRDHAHAHDKGDTGS
ncbi:MAG: putative lipoprotein [Myxococcota bacterium]